MTIGVIFDYIKEFNPYVFFHKGFRPNINEEEIEVIVLKGFPGWASYNDTIEYLSNKGYKAAVLDFGPQLKKVDIHVEELKKHIPNNKIIIIGFSLGGIIATRYVQKYGWGKIKKIITIATPFGGSPKASFAKFIPAASDLTKDSNILESISKMKFPKNKLITIGGKDDDIVHADGTMHTESIHHVVDSHYHVRTQRAYKIKEVLDKYL